MISAVITCAGNCSRFGKEKLLSLIEGKPVFIRTVEQFKKAKLIDEIVVVVRKDKRQIYEQWLKKYGIVVRLVEGDRERYASARNGVRACQGERVLVHDGARPLVTVKLINKVAKAVSRYKAVMAAVETTTSVKLIDTKKLEVKECLNRSESWLGQTPQAFEKRVILKAYEQVKKGKVTGMDDCELVRKTGVRVRVVPGEWTNKKITLPTDLAIVRQWFKLLKKEARHSPGRLDD